MSSPFTAGVVALLLLANPTLTADEVWNHDDGRVLLWKLDANFNVIAQTTVCQWHDLRAVDLCVDGTGRTYILLGKVDYPGYEVRLLDANLTLLSQSSGQGNFSLDIRSATEADKRWYVPTKIAIGGDDQVRILFNSLDGRFLLATYPSPYFWSWGVSNPSHVWVSPTQYLPYGPDRIQDGEYKYPRFYRAPKAVAIGPDNLAHVLWSGDDRNASIWKLEPVWSNPFYQFSHTESHFQRGPE